MHRQGIWVKLEWLTNTLQDAHPTQASLWRRGMDIIKHWCSSLESIQDKVLRKIFRPVRVGDDFRIRFNSELYQLLNDMDVVQRINIQRLPCLGHVVHMEEDAR